MGWPAGYAGTGIALLALDGTWLALATPRLYRPALSDHLAERARLLPALAFYVVYAAGLTVLAVAPAGAHAVAAAQRGAMLGLCAYATYDLTNLATLRNWPAGLALLDIGWGIIASALAAAAGSATTAMYARGL